MRLKHLTSTFLVGALVATGASRAAADAGDAIAGALVGGIIGHAIAKDQQRKRQQTVQRTYRPSVSSAQRQANRDMQTALNYFGFGAGSVDGSVGPGTRAAVSRYQAAMGYPTTGYIQDYERSYLMSAYSWATSGGAATSGATTPQGQLQAYQRVMAGLPAQQAPAPMMVATPPATTMVATPSPAQPAPGTSLTEAASTFGSAGAATSLAALPNLMGESASSSLASHCNRVSLQTNSNGGFVTEATMTDPAFALEEQFCLARTYAISEGEEMVSRIKGLTPQQINEQCEAFGPSMREYVSALSLKPSSAVISDVSDYLLSSGMSPSQLSGTAKICLSVGYRTDNMDVALGSALVLVALGEGVYGELLGHHLSQGFGTTQRPDLALAWYQAGLDAVDNGSRAVFAPGQPARQSLIRKAAYQVGGVKSDAALKPGETTAIPTFALAD